MPNVGICRHVMLKGIKAPPRRQMAIIAEVCDGRHSIAKHGRASELFDQLDQPGIRLHPAAYASLLQKCGNDKLLSEGKRVHESIARSEHHQDRLLLNLLVEMYGKWGRLEEAYAVFVTICEPNVFSWTILIAVYAQNGHCSAALKFFRQMDCEGVKPTEATFASILSAHSNMGMLAEGKGIHARIVSLGVESDVLRTALVGMYSRLGSMQEAIAAFSSIHRKNVVSWNSMIAAYAQCGYLDEALQVFRSMQLEGVKPDQVTFVSILDVFSRLEALAEGKLIHEFISTNAMDGNFVVGTALLNMYSSCGSVDNARITFEKLHHRDLIAWTSMVAAYAQNGHMREALNVYETMKAQGVQPNEVTLITAIWACTGLEDLAQAKKMHADVVCRGLQAEVVVANNLIDMYSCCGSLCDACQVFEEMSSRDEVSWNAMIAAYAKHEDHAKKAFNYYHRMQLEGVKPDEFTCINVLNACSNAGALAEGKEIHAFAVAEFELHAVVQNAIINMYSKCGWPEEAAKVFTGMRSKNVSSWNTMIAANAQVGCEALRLFREMDLEGVKPNEITFISILVACWSTADLKAGKVIHERIVASGFQSPAVGNALVNMYGRCGSLDVARRVFEGLDSRNIISWTAMIGAYTEHGRSLQALQLYGKLKQEGIQPNPVTYISVLGACSCTGSLREGRAIHEDILNSKLESDVFVGNVLVDMYGKCGSLAEGRDVFEKMENKDVVSWNAMIAAYAQQGHGKEAIELLEVMNLEGVKPSDITFISVMFACSHIGLVDEGREHFVSMQRDHGIDPIAEHYSCMIDILGRAGWLKEAEDLIGSMPFPPSEVTWMSLLSGCKTSTDEERGLRAAENAYALDSTKSAPYIMLSSIYTTMPLCILAGTGFFQSTWHNRDI